MILTGRKKAALPILAMAAGLGLFIIGGAACTQSPEVKEDDAHTARDALPAESTQAMESDDVGRLYRLLEERDKQLNSLLTRLDKLENEVRSLRADAKPVKATIPALLTGPTGSESPVPAFAASPDSSVLPVIAGSSVSPLPSPWPASRAGTQEEEAVQAALDRLLVRQSRLLLPPWTSELEPGFSYVHTSSDKIIIDGVLVEPVFVVGDIISQRARRDTFIPSVAWRLGLPQDFQADVRVPYRFEEVRTVSADTRESLRKADGLGDVEFGLSRQLTHGDGWAPDLLAHMRWKTKTGSDPYSTESEDPPLGTGFHAFQFMLTSVKVQDPVAFFGSLAYTLNLSDHKSRGRIDPGDILGINLGMALALNLETSLNLGWEQQFSGITTFEGNKVPGSALRIGNFRVGVTHALTRDVALDVALGIGLTQDAPDVQATVAVPIRFPGMFSGSGKPAAAKPAPK